MKHCDKIMIVEDDAGIRHYLQSTLSNAGYDTVAVGDGRSALALAASHCPDCVLLDLGLPDMDGIGIIQSIRKWSSVPIIVISARMTEDDKAGALDLGADDYLTKPFGTVELLARIRTALRHTRKACGGEELREGQYIVGDLVIDYNKHRAYLGGEDAGLTPSEFKILALLGRYAGRVLTYQQMLRELWGPAANPRDNKLLRVHMANLRRKLEKNPEEPRYLFTEVGVGYRLAEGEGTEPLSQIPPRKPKNKKNPLSTRVGLDRGFYLCLTRTHTLFGVFAREKWRPRKCGAAGRLAPVNATHKVGRYLYPQKPYLLLPSEGIFITGAGRIRSPAVLRRSAPAWHGGSKTPRRRNIWRLPDIPGCSPDI